MDEFIRKFGAHPITDKLLGEFPVPKSELHVFLRRGLYYAHRDLDKILQLHQSGKQFYIYTGRGPSSGSLHIGHLLQFLFTAYLQQLFDVQVVIQITDDEKYFTRDLTMDKIASNADSNIKDIMACGFNPDKTFIFKNTEYIANLYPIVCRIQKLLNANQIKHVFGITDSGNIGRFAFPSIQMAPCFSSSFPHLFDPNEKIHCLVPCGIDQDPFFRLQRDKAHAMGELKVSIIYSKFMPSLMGLDKIKMSASIPNSAIYLSDSNKVIRKKIAKCFSGGRDTVEEHRKLGARIEVDVAIHYLRMLLESDEELELIIEQYRTGKMLSGEVKKVLSGILIDLLTTIRDRRS